MSLLVFELLKASVMYAWLRSAAWATHCACLLVSEFSPPRL